MIEAQIPRPKKDGDYVDINCEESRRVLEEARQRVKEGLPWWHDAQFRMSLKHIASCQDCRRWLINEMP